MTEHQKEPPTWKQYWNERHDWFTRQMGRLELLRDTQSDKVPPPPLGIDWTLNTYIALREQLSLINDLRDMILEYKKGTETMVNSRDNVVSQSLTSIRATLTKLRDDLEKNVEYTTKTLQAVQNFVDRYTPLLEELEQERPYVSRIAGEREDERQD